MPGLFSGTPLERPVTCEYCERPRTECACPRDASGRLKLPKDQPARISRQRRSGNKTVTLITDLDPVATDLPALLKELRASCACGGSIAEGIIELQGDHRDRALALLKERGYPAKLAGG